MPLSLTSHLLTISPDVYLRATHHSFLKAAGNQSISRERLEAWLTQDRLYAFVGYPRFISLLVARVPFQASSNRNIVQSSSTKSPMEERILALLASSLSNIVRELEFFRETAQENGLDIMKQPRNDLSVENELIGSITKAYTDFMISTAVTGDLSDGLVLLWAMEKCYLEAWTYAQSHMDRSTHATIPGISRALEAFIHNWTTDQFRAFVDEIGSLLDEYAAAASPREYEELKQRAEQVWRWCLWYEVRFWDGE